MATKLVIIHEKVREYQTFVGTLLGDTVHIIIGRKDTPAIFLEKLALLSLGELTHVALVYHNTGAKAPFLEYTAEELATEQQQWEAYQQERASAPSKKTAPSKPFTGVVPAFLTSSLFFSTDMMSILQQLKETHGSFSTLDLITCNVRPHSQFDELDGLTVRYSTNVTGYQGDWILESHDVNVTPLYFTKEVRGYPYRLGCVAPSTQDGFGNWEITTPDELCWLMQCTDVAGPAPYLASNYILTTDINMTTIVDLSESIGKQYYAVFSGNFDGNGKTITIGTVTADFVGLFGYTQTGTISNVTIQYVYGLTLNVTIGNAAVGTLSGINSSNTFSNCSVICGPTSITLLTDMILGGCAGYCLSSSFTNCSVLFTSNVIVNSAGYLSNFSCISGYYGVLNACSCTNSSLTCNGAMTLNSGYGSTASGFCGYSFNGSTFVSSIMNISGGLVITTGMDSIAAGCIGYHLTSSIVDGLNSTIQNGLSISCGNATVVGGVVGYNNGSTVQNLSSTITGTTIIDTFVGSSPNFIGVFVGVDITGTYSNNILYLQQTILRNKSTEEGITIANPIGTSQLTAYPAGINVLFFGLPFVFYNDSLTSILYNGVSYPVGTINAELGGLLITVDDLTVTINGIFPVTEIPPCCLDTIPHVNPQTTDNDYTVRNNKRSGRAIRVNVNRFYENIALNTPTYLSPTPAFASYRDYMQYLQSKYR